jgi:hypothetical protein
MSRQLMFPVSSVPYKKGFIDNMEGTENESHNLAAMIVALLTFDEVQVILMILLPIFSGRALTSRYTNLIQCRDVPNLNPTLTVPCI